MAMGLVTGVRSGGDDKAPGTVTATAKLMVMVMMTRMGCLAANGKGSVGMDGHIRQARGAQMLSAACLWERRSCGGRAAPTRPAR